MPKYSIITVCLNEVDMIKKNLDSVVNQTYQDFEYIIIDGGSIDGTIDIIKNYTGRIDCFISEPDKGIYDAMNKGILKSCGEYLFFLNGSDYFKNYEVLNKVADINTDADIIYGDALMEIRHGKIIRINVPLNISKVYMMANTMNHQGAFIKKKLFEDVGLYDLKYRLAADYDFFMKCLFKYNCKLFYTNYPFAIQNILGVSSKIQNRRSLLSERELIQNWIFQKKEIKILRLLRIFYIVFVKYFRMFGFMIHSIINKNYLTLDK